MSSLDTALAERRVKRRCERRSWKRRHTCAGYTVVLCSARVQTCGLRVGTTHVGCTQAVRGTGAGLSTPWKPYARGLSQHQGVY